MANADGTKVWKRHLCDICARPGTCVCGYFLPCVLHGEAWSKFDKNCCVCGWLYMIPCANLVFLSMLRGKVRERNHIKGSVPVDYAVSWCCSCCSLIQITNELDDKVITTQPQAGAATALHSI